MAIIAQSRELDMKSVMCYELGPLPWSLATPDGFLRKTIKASLANNLEKLSLPIEKIDELSACIIDGMSIVQKTQANHKTFSDLANSLFSKVMHEGANSKHVDVVFDVYRENSIKDIERSKRGSSDATQFDQILPGHKIQQWGMFVKGSKNKASLIRFLCNEWKNEKYRQKLNGKSLYLAYDEECWRVTSQKVEEISVLKSYHEEADTRLLLHALHASTEGCSEVLLVCEDTDVMIIALSCCKSIPIPIYQKRGNQNRCRIVNLTKIKEMLSSETETSGIACTYRL